MPSPFADISLANTFGAAQFGLVGSCILFGIACMQTYIYLDRFPKEHWAIKYTVTLLFIMDGLSLALHVHYMYYYSVLGFGNILMIRDNIWSVQLQGVIISIMLPLVQSVYCSRIWRLAPASDKKTLRIMVLAIMLGGWGVALWDATNQYSSPYSIILRKDKDIVYAPLAVPAGIDVLLSVTMCYYLHQTRPEFAPMRTLVRRLVFWVAGTGIFTSASTLVALVLYICMPHNLIWFGWYTVLSKIYFLSLLVILNARRALRDTGDVICFSSIESSGPQLSPNSAYLAGRTEESLPAAVEDNKVYHSDAPIQLRARPVKNLPSLNNIHSIHTQQGHSNIA